MRLYLFLVLILTQSALKAQFSDDFSDGDFTANPTWSGTNAVYTINGSQQLQLNNTVAATSYLSTTHNLSDLNDREWHLWTRQSFAPSGSNFGRIYLTSSSADLTTNPDGFYLLLGEAGSNDAIRLFKCSGGTHTELLAGPLGQIAASFAVGIRVVRNASGDWSLGIDASGGTNYISAGSVNDPQNLLGTHFGVYNVYTLSNASGFYYDDIYVGDEILDLTPPVLTSATATSTTTVDVQFNEAVEQSSAENLANYSIMPSLGIISATRDAGNFSIVHLTLASPLTNGQVHTLTTNNIADLSANVSGSQNTDFAYLVAEIPVKGDVIINEFMCDPDPSVGLPTVEFVEVFNKSSKIFDLTSWKLKDASASSGTIQGGWLLPGEYRVLTATANVDSFAVAEAVSSFPSLNNSDDAIVLKYIDGTIIDSINYTDDWYKDDNKVGGGYTIERINPNDPCTDISDWQASNAVNGGTPGALNSVYNATPDTQAPSLSQIVTVGPNFIEVYYNEGMDSSSLQNATITIQSGLNVQNHFVLESYPSYSTIQFVENMQASTVYTIEMLNVADCWLNTTDLSGQFALPDVPQPGELIVNEILFDPITGGSDYLELYNNSNKLFDLKDLVFANFANDSIANHKINVEHFMLYPNEYAVFTEDSVQLKQTYPNHGIGRYIEMDIPSWNNDSGTVYLLFGGQILDKVSYEDDWHFKLLDSKDGKALERIDPNAPSDSKNNWHTAAEQIGFGTPGLANSQYYPAEVSGTFSYTSETISPDNDGFEDVLQINYQMESPGNLGTFRIFDDRGRPIVDVFASELLGIEGTFKWDGTRSDGTKASIGTYIGVFEAFDINGGVVFTAKKAFVVAGKI